MYQKNRSYTGYFLLFKNEREEEDKERASWKASDQIVRYDSVYEEKSRRLIHEVLNYKIILVHTRRTKEKLEEALDSPEKKSDDSFEDLAKLEVKLGTLSNRHLKSGITKIIL